MAGDTRIGISGWRYPRWRGSFYPRGLRQDDELRYAGSRLGSVEINGSFYSLQTPESYQHWHDETPDDFVFAVKCPRFISHMKKLNAVEEPLANFFGSGVFRLGPKMGPLLWQLPPQQGFDAGKLEAFFQILPRTWGEAAELAGMADRLVADVPAGVRGSRRKLRYALEVRHHSFEDPAYARLLRRYDIASVIAETAGKWPYFEEVTSDFLYVRLHGDVELYTSGYTDEALRRWKKKLTKLRGRSRDVFVYFDNDAKVRSPADAMRLAELMGVGPGDYG